MRLKKALINSVVNVGTFFITFIPNLILRNVFLTTLGESILGLSSLYANILGWLSIFELGIGTAIIFSLYKPFAENDRKKVRAYVNFYEKFYKTVGVIILIAGIIMVPFLKYLMKDDLNLTLVNTGFILFLLNSFVSYMFSSRLCLLNVAQEGYKVNLGVTISKLVIIVLQMIMLKVYPSFIVYSLIQLVVNLIYYIVINRYVVKQYPWIDDEKNQLEEAEKNSLIKTVRAMFLHKIGSLVVFSTDSLVISKFVGLGSLGKYGNYQMVINTFENVIRMGINGITPSIGNMLVEKDHTYASKTHKKIFFLNFWITSFIVVSLYNTLNQFVALWVGKKYLLDSLTFNVILINFYFTIIRGSIEKFKEGSGNYVQDRYAPLVEGLINLVASLVLVQYLGLAGVFIGTLISNITVIFWTQPYIVYKYVFKEKLINYYRMYLKYAVITLGMIFITSFLTAPFKADNSIVSFIINCAINVIVINLGYVLIFFKTEEFKYYYHMVKDLVKRQ